MPYISNEKRTQLDSHIDKLHRALIGLELDDDTNNMEGNLNYVITRLLRKVYDDSYRSINDAIGVLECIKLEHYRTQAAPYEDQKKFDNGDVNSTSTPVILDEIILDDSTSRVSGIPSK